MATWRDEAEAGLPDRWAVVDTETANNGRDSLCAIAVLVFERRVEIERLVTLVNPRTREWTNRQVHGIAPWDVVGAPWFARLAPRLRRMLLGVGRVFAHNAAFDRSVLEASARAAGVRFPELDWRCTVDLARASFPELPDHKLPTLARHLGVALRHHDPGSDAGACAAIVRATLGRRPPAGDRTGPLRPAV